MLFDPIGSYGGFGNVFFINMLSRWDKDNVCFVALFYNLLSSRG